MYTQCVPLRQTGAVIAVRSTSSCPATFVWASMASSIFAIMPAHVGGVSHTDTMLEVAAEVADALLKAGA